MDRNLVLHQIFPKKKKRRKVFPATACICQLSEAKTSDVCFLLKIENFFFIFKEIKDKTCNFRQ